MITLLLDNKPIIIENAKSLKFTRENTYFTNASDYTFEIEIPMSVIDNQYILGNVQRMDHTHQFSTFKASLIVDDIPLVRGKAKVTKSDNNTLTVQVLGNKSAYKDEFDSTYIDKVQYDVAIQTPEYWDTLSKKTGIIGDPDKVVFYRVHDTTNDIYNNCIAVVANGNDLTEQQTWFVGPLAPQPNLLYVIEQVFKAVGFSIDMTPLNHAPLNRIYIASARTWYLKSSDSYGGFVGIALPHWTVTEFITQIQYFFNITISFNSTTGVATIFNNGTYSDQKSVTIIPEDDYSIQISDDDDENKSLATSNLRYDMSDDENHKYDNIDDDVYNNFDKKTYNSYTDMVTAYNDMSDDLRGLYIWECPTGQYIRTGDIDTDHEKELMRINRFGTLWRNSSSDDEISLKICPVAIEAGEDSMDEHVIITDFAEQMRSKKWAYSAFVFKNDDGYWMQREWYEDEVGHSENYHSKIQYQIDQPEYMCAPAISIAQPRSQRRQGNANLSVLVDGEGVFDTQKTTTVADVLLGNKDDSSDGEDRMQVFFVDEKLELVSPTKKVTDMKVSVQVPWTENNGDHKKWSMSLNAMTDSYIGQLHNNNYSFVMQSLHTIKFLSDNIPDPASLFIINNKRYACQKLEITIDNGRINPEKTGYFYEMQ